MKVEEENRATNEAFKKSRKEDKKHESKRVDIKLKKVLQDLKEDGFRIVCYQECIHKVVIEGKEYCTKDQITIDGIGNCHQKEKP